MNTGPNNESESKNITPGNNSDWATPTDPVSDEEADKIINLIQTGVIPWPKEFPLPDRTQIVRSPIHSPTSQDQTYQKQEKVPLTAEILNSEPYVRARERYSWLAEVVEAAKQILPINDPPEADGCEYYTPLESWEFTFNPPASEEEINNYENLIGLSLPQSFRDFLLYSNGAALFSTRDCDFSTYCIYISSIDSLIKGYHTLGSYKEEIEQYVISFGDIGEAGNIGFDAKDQLPRSEYKILYLFDYETPDGWRSRPIANNFEQWLRRIFNSVILKKERPTYWMVGLGYYSGYGDNRFWDTWEGGDIPPRSESITGRFLSAWVNQETVDLNIQQQNYAAAIEEYDRYLSIYRGDFEAYKKRGIIRVLLGDKQGAIDDFTYVIKALERYRKGADIMPQYKIRSSYPDPYYPDTYFRRAEIRAELGDNLGALEDYHKAAKHFQQRNLTQEYENTMSRIQQLQGSIS